MAKARVKSAAVAVVVPQTRDQVVEAIAEIGRRQRERDRITAQMNDELAAVKQRFEQAARPHAEAIRSLTQGVQIWCEANRAALTEGGRTKTARLASGEVRWRMTPPKIVLKGIETVLQALRMSGLQRFIRTKEEVNKDALLMEPAVARLVPGVSVVQAEEFVIVPFETELEEVA